MTNFQQCVEAAERLLERNPGIPDRELILEAGASFQVQPQPPAHPYSGQFPAEDYVASWVPEAVVRAKILQGLLPPLPPQAATDIT